MESAVMYRKVREWLAQNVESNDPEWGTNTVVSFAVVDIYDFINHRLAKYGWEDDEDAEGYREEGATHVVRCLLAGDADLVDGDDFYLRVSDGEFILVNEPDRPSYCGGELDEGMRWVAELSRKYVTDLK